VVLSITTVVTLSVEDAAAPVPAALFGGKMPSDPFKGSVVCRFVVVESCLGKDKDGDLAGVVRGPVRLFHTWRLTCRGK
jgi:hypothetical protein